MEIKNFAWVLCTLLLLGGVSSAAITNSIYLTGQTVTGSSPVSGTFNATFTLSSDASCVSVLDTDATTLITDSYGRWAHYFDISTISTEQLYVGYNINRTSDSYLDTGCVRYTPAAYSEQWNPQNSFGINGGNAINLNSDGTAKTLQWDMVKSWFVFNDDVNIAGDMNISGIYYGNGSGLTDVGGTGYWNQTAGLLSPLTATDEVAFQSDYGIYFDLGTENTAMYHDSSGALYVYNDNVGEWVAIQQEGTELAVYKEGVKILPITQTTDSAALDIDVTWSNATADMQGINITITDTASAGTSDIIKARVDGVDMFEVSKFGGVTSWGGAQYFGRGSNFPQLFLGSSTMTGMGYIDTQNGKPLMLNTLAGNRATFVGDAGLYPDTTDTTNLGDGTNRWGSTYLADANIGSATNYIDIQDTGVTLYGTTRVQQNIQFIPYNIGGISGTYNGVACVASTLASLNGYYFKVFDDGDGAGQCEASNIVVHIPGDYVDGTDITLEFTMTQGGTSTNDVRWQAGRAATSDADTYSPQTYTWATPQNVAGSGTTWGRQTVTFTLNGTGLVKGDDVSIVIFRDADNAADNYVGDAYFASLDVLYTVDKLGE